ncbi:hypothetical protein K7432_004142 [Basidiobolus ranarum]|uniref:Uncharacterized protein n=1 Tax=Basidiobolus ranarum TaxID=34480 RepID=A0ABR2W5A2_9FUNG
MEKDSEKRDTRSTLFAAYAKNDPDETNILNSARIPTFSSAPDLSTLSVPSFGSAPIISSPLGDENEISSTERTSDHANRKYKRSERRETKEGKQKRHHSRDSRHSKDKKKKRTEDKPKDKYQEKFIYVENKMPLKSLLSSNHGMEKVFYIDSKGDAQNVFYGGLHKYDIPKFRRSNFGRVVGLTSALRIDTEKSKLGKEIVLNVKGYGKAKETLRYSDTRLKQHVKRIRVAKQKNRDSKSNEDFVPLDDSKAANDDKSVDYRTIEGPAKDSEEEIDPEISDDEGENFDQYIMRRSREFDQAIQENPNNVDVWLKFIAFQSEAIKFSKKGTGKSTIGEIKLSIFDKALAENPNDERLLLGYLKCCEEIMDSARLLNKWDQVLNENGHILSLWISYLNFRQSNFASFTFSQCLEVYEMCIKTLTRRSQDVNADFQAIEQVLLHIFIRVCNFLKQSGYVERAHACYQAMIELHFFCPEQYYQYSFEEQLDVFEEFWESEVPRFGENGATGWVNFNSQTAEAIDPWPLNVNSASEIHNIESWYRTESTENIDGSLPLRSMQTDDSDEDPLRVVLFDDIRSLLIPLRQKEPRMSLFYSFLQIMGLPVNRNLQSNHPFNLDTFLHAELNHQPILDSFIPYNTSSVAPTSIVNIGGVYMESERSTFTDPFKYPIKNFPQIANSVFPAQKWFGVISAEDLAHINRDFCSARKIAKNMLKADRMNLLLWNGYAKMEYKHRGFGDAQKIYSTAFSMFRTFPLEYQKEAPLLYRNFAEMNLDHENTKDALVALVHYTSNATEMNDTLTATTILKARKWYQQKLKEIESFDEKEFMNNYALDIKICYMLFEYLSQNFDVAYGVFTSYINLIQSDGHEKSTICEHLYTSFIELVFRNIQLNRAYQPKVLREVLESALELFPHNTSFLSMYLYNESRTKIENRLRRFLDSALLKEPSHILWTFYLYSELHHHQPYNIHMVRSLLEQALDSTSARNSVSLWTLYIQLEAKQGDLAKGKGLFYRAIRECPWAKDLYLLAFGVLKQAFDPLELQQIGNLLLEKEIRVRASVDDIIEPLISEMEVEQKAITLEDAA